MTDAMGKGVNQRDQIKMTPDEVEAFLAERHSMTMSTISGDGSIHSVAMWYGFLEGAVAFETKAKAQKVVNLKRDPRLTCLVETGESYDQLRGVSLVGTGEIVTEPERIWELGVSVFERYNAPYTEEMKPFVEVMLNKRVVVKLHVAKTVTWDHRKLGLPAMQPAHESLYDHEMPRGRDKEPDAHPSAPGWYPDPWSATGTGERYFDGKKWGSSERPLARHGDDADVIPIGKRKRARKPKRIRRPSRTVIAVIVIVALAAGLTLLQNRGKSSNNSAPTIETVPKPTDRPTAGHEEALRPLGVPAPVPAGNGKYEFVSHQPDDKTLPVAFDPCRPIHYVVNPAGAPADGAALVKRAIARLHDATGLVFTDDGTTTEVPDKDRAAFQSKRYGDRWAPVLIAWSDEAAFPSLAGYVAGVGGAESVYTDDNHIVSVTGQVVLDRRDLAADKARDRADVRAVILHELGHVAGLDHTSDRKQLMFSEAERNVRDYGDGDRRGLALLGTQPCHPDV